MRHNHAVAFRPSLQPPTHGTRPRIRWATSLSRARRRPTRQANEDSHMPYSRRWGALSSRTLNGWPVLAPHPVHWTTIRGCMCSTLFVYRWSHLTFRSCQKPISDDPRMLWGDRLRPTNGRLVDVHGLLRLPAGRPRSHPQAKESTLAIFSSTSPTAYPNGRNDPARQQAGSPTP